MRGEPPSLFEPSPFDPDPIEPNPANPYNNFRSLKRAKPLTCIIAQKSSKGAVMIADRRALRGSYEAVEQDKMFTLPNGVVIGAAGMKFMMDKFIPRIRRARGNRDLPTLVSAAEDIVRDLYQRYRPRMTRDTWGGFGVLVMGLDKIKSGEPTIYQILEEGYSEEIPEFEIIGHGGP
jgi:20S proteasome alpha/beta subunit